MHGEGYICIIKIYVDLVRNELMKPFHSLSLDELSLPTLWKETLILPKVLFKMLGKPHIIYLN